MSQEALSVDSTRPCGLCAGIAQPLTAWDRPLFESRHFVALPSLGSLVEGWLLVLPRRHFIATGALPPELRGELLSFMGEVRGHLEAAYGVVTAFEHGPATPHRSVGCGVDHAHVHMVPTAVDLVVAAQPFMPAGVSWQGATWSDAAGPTAADLDYLFVELPSGQGMMATSRDFGSQVLRKALATAIGAPREFSWREHPKHEKIEATIRRMSAVSATAAV